MTPSLVTDLAVNPFELDHADLARHLAALLADEYASARALCRAIQASRWRRLHDAEDGEGEDLLTPTERVCVDALDLQTQVDNGGLQQWVENGYWGRGYQTHEGLNALGARRTARLLRKALRALPPHAKAALDAGTADAALPYIHFGPRRETYFNRLDAAYYALAGVESIEVLVAAYARRGGREAVRHPVP